MKFINMFILSKWNVFVCLHDCFMYLSVFSPRSGGIQATGIRLQTNPNPWELDIKHLNLEVGKHTSSGISNKFDGPSKGF